MISTAAGNDLTFDTDGLYIDAADTDDQALDVSTFTASGLNLSLEDDGVATVDIPLISTAAGNDLTFDTDGLYIDAVDTDDQTITQFFYNGTDLVLGIEDGNVVSTPLAFGDDQTLQFNEGDPNDGVNTLTIEGHAPIEIVDNHLATHDQRLTDDREVEFVNHDLTFSTIKGNNIKGIGIHLFDFEIIHNAKILKHLMQ